jgi:uncharacterized protein YggT (Ycf19 family)
MPRYLTVLSISARLLKAIRNRVRTWPPTAHIALSYLVLLLG